MRFALVLALALGSVLLARCALALSPDSPEVKKAIALGTKFLEKNNDNRLGGKCLVGLVFVKQGQKDNHPQVAEAVAACKAACKAEADKISEDIYSTGIAIIFLCETDASKYRAEIIKLMQSLELRQRAAGGWGYPVGATHGDTGDTSMTQYAVLATWTAYRSGVDISQDSVERVCNWLLRTQDPSGAFGYQGKDPGEGKYTRLEQGDIRNSLSAAGSGSLYICADLLRFKVLKDQRQADEQVLPPALVLVDDGKKDKGPITAVVPGKVLTKSLADANGWMSRNYKVDQGHWNLYHLYALERYQSFRELAENIKDDEPKWYTEGARHLIKTQGRDGSWEKGCGEAVDTAFGVLFLLRSTKKTIQKTLKKFGDGQLTGGRGLPASTADVTVKHGKVVGASLAGQIDDLVAILEEGEGSNFEYIANNPEEFKLAEDAQVRQSQIQRLRRLASATAYEARYVAVKQLARSKDFDSVPTLIYALSDPDARIVREADAGLRFIARRIGPSSLPDNITAADKQTAAEQWTKWYTSVRPDAEIKK